MSTPREAARKTLAGLLELALVGDGKPAHAVYPYQVGDFRGATPVVAVTSGPMQRSPDSFGGCWRMAFQLRVFVFVAYADESGAWTEAEAEDALDAIEEGIAAVVLGNPRTAAWTMLTYGDNGTQLDAVVIGGVEYRRELITLDVQLF